MNNPISNKYYNIAAVYNSFYLLDIFFGKISSIYFLYNIFSIFWTLSGLLHCFPKYYFLLLKSQLLSLIN